jgi:hypothetical protein
MSSTDSTNATPLVFQTLPQMRYQQYQQMEGATGSGSEDVGSAGAGAAAGSDTSDTGSPRAVVEHFPSFASSAAASSLGGAGGSVLADMDLQRVNSTNSNTNPTSFKMTPILKSIWKKSFWGSVKECFTRRYGPSPFANCPSHMF